MINKKNAFTLLELVFIIVVIGIIAATLVPKKNDDSLMNALSAITSDIRYTQHLALQEDALQTNDNNWFKKRWQILFYSNEGKWYYTIYKDKNADGTLDNSDTYAKNPLDPTKILKGDGENATKRMKLSQKYNIVSLSFECDGTTPDRYSISFDYTGRPSYGSIGNSPYTSLIEDSCTLSISNNDTTQKIKIEKETGYTCILNENDECI